MKKREKHFDIYFLITVLVLLGFGLIMIMSASSSGRAVKATRL